MDEGNAPEVDQDVVLEKSARGDLPGFEKRLKSFLWTNGGREVKGHVRVRDTDALVAVVCLLANPEKQSLLTQNATA
jgi:hypothetical protein